MQVANVIAYVSPLCFIAFSSRPRSGYFSINENRSSLVRPVTITAKAKGSVGRAAVRFNWSVRLNWRFSAAGSFRFHTAKNGARCVSMRSDAMRRIRWLWSNGAVERKICGRKTSKRGLVGAVKSFRAVQGARGGKRQTSKFHMAPRLCYVLSFDSGTYSLTREPARVHPIHVKFLLDLLAPCVRLESLSKAAISLGRFVQVLVLNLSKLFRVSDN